MQRGNNYPSVQRGGGGGGGGGGPNPSTQSGNPCGCGKGCIWLLIWIIILVFFAWPIAMIMCPIYVLALPWKACCDCCNPVVDGLYEAVLLPLVCAENAVAGKPMC